MELSAASEFRRGWRTLLASSVGIASGLSGLAFYTFGVFILPLGEAFGWTRGQVSIAASFLIIGTAITAPIVGTIIDKFGARRVGLWSTFFCVNATERQHSCVLCRVVDYGVDWWRYNAGRLDAGYQYLL